MYEPVNENISEPIQSEYTDTVQDTNHAKHQHDFGASVPLFRRVWAWFVACIGVLLIIICGGLAMLSSPKNFVPDTLVIIQPGMTFKQGAQLLENNNIIRSSGLMQLCAQAISVNETIIAGEYIFEKPGNACSIAYRMTRGVFGNSRMKITIPEGSTNRDIARLIATKIPMFDVNAFITTASKSEGYLFPETYFWFKTATPDQVITRMRDEYTTRVSPLYPDMNATGRTESDIIIMASILEREAKNADEAKTIAGILYRRMGIGMPLQVDATFLYSAGKTSSELTLNDLRTDSVWNTYTRTGLPPGAIGNPELDMIRAAINPTPSKYLYYLHDAKGNVHYAATYDEHVRNKQKYLR